MPIFKKKSLTPAEQFKKTREALGYKRNPITGKIRSPVQTIATRMYKLETPETKIKRLQSKKEVRHGPREYALTLREKRIIQLNKKYLNTLLSKRKTNVSAMYTEFEKKIQLELLKELKEIANKYDFDLDQQKVIEYINTDPTDIIEVFKSEPCGDYVHRVNWKNHVMKQSVSDLRSNFKKVYEWRMERFPVHEIKTSADAIKFLNAIFEEAAHYHRKSYYSETGLRMLRQSTRYETNFHEYGNGYNGPAYVKELRK